MCELMDGQSMNIEKANMDKLKGVFPECFAEGKLDIDKLLSLCGEYIDNDFEKYKFEWKGKSECLRLAQKRSTGTLRPCPEESVNWDTTQNLYIEGDNLEVLKLLQTTYYRKVKMIYIDPPYNTGNDFVYADDFADPMARYKEITEQTTKSNPETMGRYHTNWLNMMYPRLRLAANLLRDDGVIFISIDDNEVTNLRKICDEVFGEENFIASISWKRKKEISNDSKNVAIQGEYVVVYGKSNQTLLGLEPISQDYLDKSYNEPTEQFPLGKWRPVPITVSKGLSGGGYMYEVTTPTGVKHERLWAYPPKSFEKLVAEGRIYYGKDNSGIPQRVMYAFESKGQPISNYWETTATNKEGKKEILNILGDNYFDTPKPVNLLKRIMRVSTDKDSIILDFFSGSATTAHAVMQLNAEDGGNRQFIMVQLPELCDEKSEAYKAGYKNICEIGKERIRRAGEKICNSKKENEDNQQLTLQDNSTFYTLNSTFPNLDIGFKVYKLDTSNLKTWDSSPIESDNLLTLYNRMNEMIHRVKSDRTDLDMISEIMLKLGVPLTYPVAPITLNDKQAYTVGDDCLLLICLAENVQPQDVEAMAEYAPAKIIIARDSFIDDTAMSNAYYILRDRQIELKLV